jgi:hypothetical protein
MNANELADEIEQAIADQEFATSKSEKWHKSIADFVRQQQAEIEALKAELKMTKSVVSEWQKWKAELQEFVK